MDHSPIDNADGQTGRLTGLNRTIKFLIASDVVLISAANLMVPVFALFVIDRISGANAAVVGISWTLYYLAKSLIQVPVARFVDRRPGERDDYAVMVVTTMVGSLLPLAFLFIDRIWQLYAVQLVSGLIWGAAFPTYMAIFSRHLDRDRESTAWGVRFSLTDLSSALTALTGGLIAYRFGFNFLIVLFVVMGVAGSGLLVPIGRNMLPVSPPPAEPPQ